MPPKKFSSSSNMASNKYAVSPEGETSLNSDQSAHWGSPDQAEPSGLTPPPRSPSSPVRPPGTASGSPSSPVLQTSPVGTASTTGSAGPALCLSGSEGHLSEEVYGIPPEGVFQAAMKSCEYGL